jgi:hypothetical protein
MAAAKQFYANKPACKRINIIKVNTIAMSADTIFQICSTTAFFAWLILILASPFWKNTDKLLTGIIIMLFAVVYTWLISSSFNPADLESFGTLDGIMRLFSNKTVVTAGWVHYLAFDLMTGIWITKNARKHGINHWLTVPCLLCTFMLGPFGLLLYLLLRWVVTKKYFAEN